MKQRHRGTDKRLLGYSNKISQRIIKDYKDTTVFSDLVESDCKKL